MKTSDYIFDSAVNLLLIVISCIIPGVAAALVCYAIGQFIELEFYVFSIVRTVIITIGTPALLYLLKYKEGYKFGEYSRSSSIITIAIGSVIHILVSAVFSFAPIVAGAPLYLSGLISFGSNFDGDEIANIPLLLIIGISLLYAVIYNVVMNFAKSYGAQCRKIDRYKLTGEV